MAEKAIQHRLPSQGRRIYLALPLTVPLYSELASMMTIE
jgi:hypothetical protein